MSEANTNNTQQTVYGIDDAVSAYLAQNNAGGGGGEGGGQTVSVSPTQNSGTEIGKITVGLSTKTLYAPTPAQPGDKVTVSRKVSTGTNIADITVNGTTTKLYAPAASSGGSTVSVTPALNSGTKVADITVDGVNKVLYAPTPSGGGQGGSVVSVDRTLNSGTKIATLTIDGAGTDLYAPTPSGGGGGSTVTVNRKLNSGTNIADLTIDGVTTQLYAPAQSGGGGGTIVAGSDKMQYMQEHVLAEHVNAYSIDVDEDTAFYIEGFFDQNGTSSGTFSLHGIDAEEVDHVLTSGINFSTNNDTYFAIYGKNLGEGRWVCWAKTGISPTASPTGSGVAIGSSSFHPFGWTDNNLGTIKKLKIQGSKAIKASSVFRIFTVNQQPSQ